MAVLMAAVHYRPHQSLQSRERLAVLEVGLEQFQIKLCPGQLSQPGEPTNVRRLFAFLSYRRYAELPLRDR